MRRLALIALLACACVPRALVDQARDRDRDGFDAWQLGGDDCDDAAPAVNPDADEACGNEVDDDCDGEVDEDGLGASTWYEDVDRDGYGATGEARAACAQPEGFTGVGGDCDDSMVACDLDADPAVELVVFDATFVPGTVGGIATYSSSAINVLDTPITTSWPPPVARVTSTDAADYPGGGTGRRLLCGDLDGDGNQDLVAGRAGDNGAFAFRGPLVGVRGSDDAAWTVGGAYPLDLGDIDDDGRDELLVGDAGGNVEIWGVGPGGDWDVETTLSGPALGWSGRFGDFDGDTLLDLALVEQTGSASAGRVLVFLHPTLGGTTALTADSADSEIAGSSTVNLRSVGTPGDVDLDGDEELCVVAPSDDTLGPNTGGVYCFGRLASSPSWDLDQADLVLVGEAAGSAQGPSDPHRDARILEDVDLDGDGVLDLVLGWPYNDAGAVDAGAVFVLYGLAL